MNRTAPWTHNTSWFHCWTESVCTGICFSSPSACILAACNACSRWSLCLVIACNSSSVLWYWSCWNGCEGYTHCGWCWCASVHCARCSWWNVERNKILARRRKSVMMIYCCKSWTDCSLRMWLANFLGLQNIIGGWMLFQNRRAGGSVVLLASTMLFCSHMLTSSSPYLPVPMNRPKRVCCTMKHSETNKRL